MQTESSRLTSGTTSTGIALRVERDGDTARIVHAATGNTAVDDSGPLVYDQGPGSWTCAREALGIFVNDPESASELRPDVHETIKAHELRDGDVIVNRDGDDIPVLLATPQNGLVFIWTTSTGGFGMSPSCDVQIQRREPAKAGA